jgi:ankyrin repeat protein
LSRFVPGFCTLNAQKEADVAKQTDGGWTALHFASSESHHKMVELLLDADPDGVSTRDKLGCTPLLLASRKGHLEVANLLLAANADACASDVNGSTPLLEASSCGHLSMVQRLLTAGAIVTTRDKNGRTALSRAASNGHTGIVKLLLEAGAEISTRNDGSTALHDASGNGHLEVVNVLLEAGADVAALSNIGNTPLNLASWHGHAVVLDRLLEFGRNKSQTGNGTSDVVSHLEQSVVNGSEPSTDHGSWLAGIWCGDRPYRGINFDMSPSLIVGNLMVLRQNPESGHVDAYVCPSVYNANSRIYMRHAKKLALPTPCHLS